jgi:hypothetical protein
MPEQQQITKVTVDCHAYPWHERPEWMADDECPEVGPNNLVRMAEEFGVLIRHLSDEEAPAGWAGWAWWYEIEGPPEHIVRLLTAEYSGCEALAREMVYGAD